MLNSHWWNHLCHGLMTWQTSCRSFPTLPPSTHPSIHLKKRRKKGEAHRTNLSLPLSCEPLLPNLRSPRRHHQPCRSVPASSGHAQHDPELPKIRTSPPPFRSASQGPQPRPLLGFLSRNPPQPAMARPKLARSVTGIAQVAPSHPSLPGSTLSSSSHLLLLSAPLLQATMVWRRRRRQEAQGLALLEEEEEGRT